LASLRWLKQAGRFSFGASASYRKNFDRYDWTRGTAMNRHNTDNVGARLWADYDWRAGTTSLGGDYAFNHIYSTNLGEPLPTPHAKSLLDKGVQIEQVNGIKTLFTVSPKDGSYKINFGEEEFMNYFKAFLRPQLVEMLF
jgi:hypothetical protein